jgi:hypothetical protein
MGWQIQIPRYDNPSDSTAQPMHPQRQPRRTITLDLPPEQVSWLDRQAATALISRSGYVRQLIAQAIQQQAPA